MKERHIDESVDYKNAKVINDILVSEDAEAHEELRRANAWSREKMVMFQHYIRMRDRMHKRMAIEKVERMKHMPEATDVEMSMGAYVDQIEPHVRGAVLRLREKGYATFSSGFYGRDVQEISFMQNDLDGWWFDDQFVDWLAERGANLRPFHGDIKVDMTQQLSEDELKSMFDAIAQNMPDLDRAAPMSNTLNAQNFRKAQMRLKQLTAYKKVHHL